MEDENLRNFERRCLKGGSWADFAQLFAAYRRLGVAAETAIQRILVATKVERQCECTGCDGGLHPNNYTRNEFVVECLECTNGLNIIEEDGWDYPERCHHCNGRGVLVYRRCLFGVKINSPLFNDRHQICESCGEYYPNSNEAHSKFCSCLYCDPEQENSVITREYFRLIELRSQRTNLSLIHRIIEICEDCGLPAEVEYHSVFDVDDARRCYCECHGE